jgi:hypothetical protein
VALVRRRVDVDVVGCWFFLALALIRRRLFPAALVLQERDPAVTVVCARHSGAGRINNLGSADLLKEKEELFIREGLFRGRAWW